MTELGMQQQLGAAISDLLGAYEFVTDPRGAQGKRHRLDEILLIATLGCMCGCDNAEALEDWAGKEEEWLRNYLELRWGTPSQDTFLRVLAAIDVREFETAFRCWTRKVFPALANHRHFAMDGKTARRSGDRAAEECATHMVSALDCDDLLVVGQTMARGKGHELQAQRALLDLMQLENNLVSIDALGCQKDIATKIRKRGGDYLLGLRGNQKNMYRETSELFEATLAPERATYDGLPEVETHTNVDGGHDRIDTRTTHVLHAWGDWVPETEKWKDLRTLIRVDATREHLGTGVVETESRHYISSRKLSAKEATERVRAHWRVENGLHYVLDVTFGEDSYRARKKNAAHNFIVIRHFAVNMLRATKDRKYSLPRTRRLCDYNVEFREQLLSRATG